MYTVIAVNYPHTLGIWSHTFATKEAADKAAKFFEKTVSGVQVIVIEDGPKQG